MKNTAGDSGSSCGLKFLVADDHPDSAESLSILLRLMECEVQTATDGAQTIESAATFLPDVACLDIAMPLIDGYEVARHIREQAWGKSMILVAVTGRGREEDRDRAREAGFDHHLTKPVELAELEKLVTLAHTSKRPSPM